MSESLPPEKGANDRAFGVACWTLGGLAFVLLLMVGVSFSLSVRTVVVEKVVEKPVPVPAREKQERPAGVVENGAAEETVHMADVPAPPSEKPRSVEEIQADLDAANALLDGDGWTLNREGGEYNPETDDVRCKEIDGTLVALDLKLIYPEGNAIADE